jgi:hypothetical protein
MLSGAEQFLLMASVLTAQLYVLRPAPQGKILRDYQAYGIAGALNATSIGKQQLGADVLQAKMTLSFLVIRVTIQN